MVGGTNEKQLLEAWFRKRGLQQDSNTGLCHWWLGGCLSKHHLPFIGKPVGDFEAITTGNQIACTQSRDESEEIIFNCFSFLDTRTGNFLSMSDSECGPSPSIIGVRN